MLRLETDRLILRHPTARDVDAIHRMARSRQVTRWMTLPSPYEREHAAFLVKLSRREARQGVGWHLVLERKDDGAVLGSAGLMSYQAEHRRAELGYWLGVRHRGRGYASEAAGGLLKHAFHQMRLRKVHALTFSGNEPSARVLQRAGFTHEGHLRDHLKKSGRWHDVDLWGLLATDFRRRRP